MYIILYSIRVFDGENFYECVDYIACKSSKFCLPRILFLLIEAYSQFVICQSFVHQSCVHAPFYLHH